MPNLKKAPNTVELLTAGELFGAFPYASLFGAKAHAREAGAAIVYAFKRFGRRADYVAAIVRAAADKLSCDAIAAVPASGIEVSQVQALFGMTIKRVCPVAARRENHAAELGAEYGASLGLDAQALDGARRILLVDDVAITGRTLRATAEWLRERTGAEVIPFALGLSTKLNPAASGVTLCAEDGSGDGDLFGAALQVEERALFSRAETLSMEESARVSAVRRRLERGRSVSIEEFEAAVACLQRIGDERRASRLDQLLSGYTRELIRGGARRINGDLLDWYRRIDPEEVAAWESGADAGPKSGADRKADSIARRTSVPQIDEPADPARRERCRGDLVAFGLAYCSMFLERPPSEKMMDFIRSLQNAVLGSGLTHVRWPRGKGKTTWCKIALLWASLYGHRKYIVVISAAQPSADQIISEIWDALETGDELAEDFPEACVPVRLINGKIQRCAGQTYGPTGALTKIKKSSNMIDLPTIEGFACAGVRIQARGIEASARGLVNKTRRPDFLMIDDPQTDETARSPAQTRIYELKISKTFLGLMGHSRNMSAVMTSTVISAGDLSDRFANTNLHPEWKTHTSRLLESFPSCYKTENDPWQIYFDLRAQDIANGDIQGYSRSNCFYAAHREKLDAGAVVMDPSDGDPQTESSAVQHAMNLLFTLGEEAFLSEYQLDPPRSSSVFELLPERVSGAVNGLAPSTVPHECDALVASIDVMREKGLRWTVTAFGPNRTAAVVGYGRFPANGQPLWPALANEEDRDTALDMALRIVCVEFARLTFQQAGGRAPLKISAVGIDAGYMTGTVSRFCRKHAGLFQRLEAMRGVPWMKFAPLRTDGKKRGNVRFADEWAYSSTTEHGRFLNFHSDFWRELQQRSWLQAPLQTGSLSVYGSRPEAHHAFALEVCGDRLLDKDQTVEGRGIWTWASAGQNHWGDCLTMCFALAYWHKIYTLYERPRASADSVSETAREAPVAALPAPAANGPARPRPREQRRLMIVER